MFANQRYQKLFDLTEDELRQMSPEELKACTRARIQTPKLSQPRQDLISDNVKDVVEAVGEDSQSEPRLLYRSITPLGNDHGDSAGNVVSYRDISKEVDPQQMNVEMLRLHGEPVAIPSFSEL